MEIVLLNHFIPFLSILNKTEYPRPSCREEGKRDTPVMSSLYQGAGTSAAFSTTFTVVATVEAVEVKVTVVLAGRVCAVPKVSV